MTLKSRIAIVSVLVTGIAIVGAGTTSSASGTYEVTADTIEGCSCPLFCTCYFGASSDEHKCEANNVYKFRKGSHYGDVDLSDAMVWVNLDSKRYHKETSAWYGRTKNGKYMSEADAIKAGYQVANMRTKKSS